MNTEKKLNKIIIISSPSGAGKTTICKELLKTSKDINISISYTTRQKRINEKNGKDYYFVTNKEFINLKKNHFFIETAKVFNHYYGSPHNNIINSFKKNKSILFDIDWQGAKKLRKQGDGKGKAVTWIQMQCTGRHSFPAHPSARCRRARPRR